MVLYGFKLGQYWDNDGIIIEYQWIYPLSSSVAGKSSHQMEMESLAGKSPSKIWIFSSKPRVREDFSKIAHVKPNL